MIVAESKAPIPESYGQGDFVKVRRSWSLLSNPNLCPALPPPLLSRLPNQKYVLTMSSRRVFWERTSVPMSIVSCSVG